MPVVKVMGRGQVTIPKRIREALALKEGDFVDVEVENNRVVIIPQKLVRTEALKRLRDVMERVHSQNPDVSEQEVVELALKELHTMRQEDDARIGTH